MVASRRAPEAPEAAAAAEAPGVRVFDGIVCLGGEDWWYHNRGHFDIQLMRAFSGSMPVLYVNSLGARLPTPNRTSSFAKRILRKAKSVAKGLSRVDEGFSVLSVPTIPGMNETRALLAIQTLAVRSASRRMGMTRPLLWIALPTAIHLAEALDCAGKVYQRTDKFEAEEDVGREELSRLDLRAKSTADLTLFASRTLLREESGACRRAIYVDHGVDYRRFAAARDNPAEPADMAGIPRPRVGYVGSLDPITIDQELVSGLAAAMPDASFVFVGPSTLGKAWRGLPNVHSLGQKDYGAVPAYMAACDALIMPWRDNEWIRSCNPVKLKEYLAVGRPVVSTYFPELDRYRGLVGVAKGVEGFSAALRERLLDPPRGPCPKELMAGESWESKAGLVERGLAAAGLLPARPAGSGAAPGPLGGPARRGEGKR